MNQTQPGTHKPTAELPPSADVRETVIDRATAFVERQWPGRSFPTVDCAALYILHLEESGAGLDEEMRAVGREFAYLHTTSVIETNCTMVERNGLYTFYDTRSADVDLTDEVRYLQARRLLDLHPDHPHWVSLRDEDEPLPEGQGGY